MAAKQSKIWAYIILILVAIIIGWMIYYFGWLKPGFEREIEKEKANTDYYLALYDSCVNAKTYTDTIIYESVVYDTITFVVKKGEIYDNKTAATTENSQIFDNSFSQGGTEINDFSSIYKTKDFDLPYKIKAKELYSVTFLPYTIRSRVATTSHVIDCPPCPELKPVAERNIFASIYIGYGGSFISGADLTYMGKKGLGAQIGYATTFDKHFGTAGVVIKIK